MNGRAHEEPAEDCKAHAGIRVTLEHLVKQDDAILLKVARTETKIWLLIAGVVIQLFALIPAGIQLFSTGR